MGKLSPIMDIVQKRADEIEQDVHRRADEIEQGVHRRAGEIKQDVHRRAGELEQHVQRSLKAPPGPVEAGPLPALMEEEKAALKTSAAALEHLKGATAEAQKFVAEREAASRQKRDADKVVSDAMSQVTDAKRKRVDLAKMDLKSSPIPDDGASKALDAANARVADAEKTLLAATRLAAVADGAVEKAATKAKRAFEAKAVYKDELQAARTESDRLAVVVSREEKRLHAAVANLQREADSISAATERQLHETHKASELFEAKQ